METCEPEGVPAFYVHEAHVGMLVREKIARPMLDLMETGEIEEVDDITAVSPRMGTWLKHSSFDPERDGRETSNTVLTRPQVLEPGLTPMEYDQANLESPTALTHQFLEHLRLGPL